MKYVNYVKYNEDPAKVQARRPAHHQYATGLMANGELAIAGPFKDGSGALLIYEAESLEDAEALFTNDPYATGEAVIEHEIHPWHVLDVNLDLLKPS